MIRSAVLVLLPFLLAGCSSLPLDRLVFGLGLSRAPIEGKDILAETQGIRFEIATDRITGLPARYGRLNLGLELYGSTILRPERAAVFGATPIVHYSYPLTEWVSPYFEFGAGPVYLGLVTSEQERSGFSFYDQVGAGLEFTPSDQVSILVGYRFGHFSHGGTRETKNRGIETDTVLFGLSFKLP